MKPLKLRAAHAATLCLAIIGSMQPLQVFAQKTQPSQAVQTSGVSVLTPIDKAISDRVNSLTLEQKVGQMTQIDLGVIAVGSPCGLQQPQTLDQEKLRIAIEKYHIGSILNVGCGSGTIALDRWQEIHKGISTASVQYSSTQIPILFGIDAIHGVNYTVGGTLFPSKSVRPLHGTQIWS